MSEEKLDIGCGEDKHDEDYLGLDAVETDEADVVHDLETGELPFEDDRFGKVVSINCLEHLSQETYIHIMEEIGRVAKSGADVKIVGPYYLSWVAEASDHHRAFSRTSMNVFTEGHEYSNRYPKVFSNFTYSYNFGESISTRILKKIIPNKFLATTVPNTAHEIEFDLTVK